MSNHGHERSHVAEQAQPGHGAATGALVKRLAVELLIGLAIAAVLLLVAWASSNTIKFVYGGY